MLDTLAQLAKSEHLLSAAVATLGGCVAWLYRDCRTDRDKLWAHIRELERRIGRQEP